MNDHGLIPSMATAVGGERPTQDQIDKAVATIRQLCGWHVWPRRSETLRLDGTGDETMILPTKRLVDVTALTVNGEHVGVDKVGWSDDGLLYRRGGFPFGFRNVAVTITHGHDSAPDLAAVALEMAARSMRPAGNISVGSISVGAATGATPQSSEWRIVDLYKLGPLP